MSAARHAVALVLMLSVAGGAGWFALLKPRFDAIEAAEREEARLKAEFAVVKDLAVNLDLYREQLLALDERFGVLLAALPRAEHLASAAGQQDVERQIQAMAKALGMPAPVISAGRASHEQQLAARPYAIDAAGDFQQLVRFLQGISTGSGRFWTIQSAALQRAETGPGLTLSVALQVHGFVGSAAPAPSMKERR